LTKVKSFDLFSPDTGDNLQISHATQQISLYFDISEESRALYNIEENREHLACQFWEDNTNEWSRSGVNLVEFGPESTQLECRTNHLTAFSFRFTGHESDILWDESRNSFYLQIDSVFELNDPFHPGLFTLYTITMVYLLMMGLSLPKDKHTQAERDHHGEELNHDKANSLQVAKTLIRQNSPNENSPLTPSTTKESPTKATLQHQISRKTFLRQDTYQNNNKNNPTKNKTSQQTSHNRPIKSTLIYPTATTSSTITRSSSEHTPSEITHTTTHTEEYDGGSSTRRSNDKLSVVANRVRGGSSGGGGGKGGNRVFVKRWAFEYDVDYRRRWDRSCWRFHYVVDWVFVYDAYFSRCRRALVIYLRWLLLLSLTALFSLEDNTVSGENAEVVQQEWNTKRAVVVGCILALVKAPFLVLFKYLLKKTDDGRKITPQDSYESETSIKRSLKRLCDVTKLTITFLFYLVLIYLILVASVHFGENVTWQWLSSCLIAFVFDFTILQGFRILYHKMLTRF